jgi:hypothetical protein
MQSRIFRIKDGGGLRGSQLPTTDHFKGSNKERFARSPNGASKGALFAVAYVPPDIISLAATIKGFRGLKLILDSYLSKGR